MGVVDFDSETYLLRSMSRYARYLSATSRSCVLWSGKVDREGYGCFSYRGKYVKAHRWMYEMSAGPIPRGLVIDHRCDNRACVNPDHLKAVTNRENLLRSKTSVVAANARKTRCKWDHPFDAENTGYTKSGTRVCRTCQRIWGSLRWKKDRRALMSRARSEDK